ncbi:SDR family NAD(P)-dependent oxidoreductase [Tropicimonas sediminicola]|uniref:2-deoxy-D-gluconate 3-dehydrogenase n=1 Tax=Tropicimonas sediminicola TaxID=1031541 RepID=A0A239J6N9_9RHOB|nr:SDR family oxidoreductase [Tropicimonas sediminicola]SNT01527.1 2-deoxy-D-gluconate 3-dehydrogenase [Tropicimonas sediminicola]
MRLPRTPSFRLDGRTALVTGASSGIGLGCAAALAQAGAHVVCAARGAGRLQEVVDALREDGCSAEAQVLDVSSPEVLDAVFSERAAFDIVVNSAGLARHAPALQTSAADYDAVMATNLRAAHFLSAAAARAMIAAGKPGSIIHISSQMGHVGGIERTVYAASKHGLEGMVKSMAIEWGQHGIRINTLCPTFIRTPLAAQTLENPERSAWIEDKIKLGRVGEIEDIMGGVVFLASDAASMVTGTALLIDGGWTAD